MSLETSFCSPSLTYVFFAGAVANSTELVLGGQILDRIKTKLQSEVGLTTKEAVQSILHKEGVRGFGKGSGWNLGGAGFKGGIRWMSNTASDRLYSDLFSEKVKKNHPLLFTAAVGLTAGIVDATVTNFFDRSKTFVMSSSDKREIWQRIQTRPIGFFFDGWARICAKQMVISTTYQLSYIFLKRRLEKTHPDRPISWNEKILLGYVPGLIGAVMSTLPDLLKTQAQIPQSLGKNAFRSVLEIFSRHGFKGFYGSLFVKMIRSSNYSLITFLVMDQLGALPNNMRIK